MLSRFSKAWERKDEYVFPSGFRHGSRLGSNRNSKIKPPGKVQKARTKPRKFIEFPWLWHAYSTVSAERFSVPGQVMGQYPYANPSCFSGL